MHACVWTHCAPQYLTVTTTSFVCFLWHFLLLRDALIFADTVTGRDGGVHMSRQWQCKFRLLQQIVCALRMPLWFSQGTLPFCSQWWALRNRTFYILKEQRPFWQSSWSGWPLCGSHQDDLIKAYLPVKSNVFAPGFDWIAMKNPFDYLIFLFRYIRYGLWVAGFPCPAVQWQLFFTSMFSKWVQLWIKIWTTSFPPCPRYSMQYVVFHSTLVWLFVEQHCSGLFLRRLVCF